MPEIEALAQEFAGRATVVKIDIDRFLFVEKNVRYQFKITSLPLLIVFKDGQEVSRLVGSDRATIPAIRDAVTAALADAEPEVRPAASTGSRTQ